MSPGLTLVKLCVTVCPAVGEPAVQPGDEGQLNTTDALVSAGVRLRSAAAAITLRRMRERPGVTTEPLFLIGSMPLSKRRAYVGSRHPACYPWFIDFLRPPQARHLQMRASGRSFCATATQFLQAHVRDGGRRS